MKALALLFLLSSPCIAGQLPSTPPNGVTYYTLIHANEGNGSNVWDVQGKKWQYAESWVSGLFNTGLGISGAANNGNCLANTSLSYGMSGAWVHVSFKSNSTTLDSQGHVLAYFNKSSGNYTAIYLYNNTIILYEFVSGVNKDFDFTPNPGVRSKKWITLDFIRGATYANYWDVYVNGKFAISNTTTVTSPATPTSIVRFGCGDGSPSMDGILDELFLANISTPNNSISGMVERMYVSEMGRHNATPY